MGFEPTCRLITDNSISSRGRYNHFDSPPYIFIEQSQNLSEEKQEIVLKIGRDVASYFKRRKLIANQVIEKELEDGGLIVSAKVGHPNQIVPIVRYWIPHVRIISPEKLQDKLEAELACYLE